MQYRSLTYKNLPFDEKATPTVELSRSYGYTGLFVRHDGTLIILGFDNKPLHLSNSATNILFAPAIVVAYCDPSKENADCPSISFRPNFNAVSVKACI